MRLATIILGTVLAISTGGGGAAQPAAPACSGIDDSALPADLSAWRTPAAPLKGETLPLGHAVVVQLKPAASLRYAVKPQKDGVGAGGVLRLHIAAAGDYRIALSAGAWIDVVRNGQAIQSNAHAHGPACSSVRKIVDFPLQPGDYLVQIAGSPQPAVTVLAARKR